MDSMLENGIAKSTADPFLAFTRIFESAIDRLTSISFDCLTDENLDLLKLASSATPAGTSARISARERIVFFIAFSSESFVAPQRERGRCGRPANPGRPSGTAPRPSAGGAVRPTMTTTV